MKNENEYKYSENKELDIREEITKYLRHWPWFILSLIVLLSIASLYLRYASPIYRTNATILIKDESNRTISEIATFQDMGFVGGLSPSGFENEIQILKSNSLTARVVRNLDLNISYYSEENLRSTEIYGNIPFKVHILTPDSLLTRSFDPIYVDIISKEEFEIWNDENEVREISQFGDIISLPQGEIQIVLNKEKFSEDKEYNPIKIIIRTIPSTVAQYRNRIEIEQMTKLSSVIQLTLNSPNRKKSEAVLNEFIDQYNQDAIVDRNMVSRNTADFIQSRLAIISEELDSVETGKVEFKQTHKLTDLGIEGRITLEKESEFNKALLDIEVQLELAQMTIDYINEAGENDLLPVISGVGKEGIGHSLEAYNQAVLDRSRLLIGSTEKNPSVVSLTEQIQELKANILAGMTSAQNSLKIKRNDLIEQKSKIDTKISSAPSKEKLFRGINRQQELKESLYLYLLQKREENAISMAVTAPKAKVVDYAFSTLNPISPKRGLIMLAAFIGGLLIPFLIIYLRLLLDNKIRSKADIEKIIETASVVGEIPKLQKKDRELIKANDRSVLAESFRMLSTNMEYLFVNNKERKKEGKVILITSSMKGEGKTFVSYNYAITLANSGAKVILVGGDLRNPQIHRYKINNDDFTARKGIVEFLVHQGSSVEDYISKSEVYQNLDLLHSGTIPPNPAELLMLGRLGNMFEELKNLYDYIIVDTAPAMLVTDTFLYRDYADTTIYVTRAGYTPKLFLNFAKESIERKKLQNVAFLINNMNFQNLGYGSKYGYYYGYTSESNKNFWKKLKRNF